MSITIEMTFYVCKHCGCPYGLPTTLVTAKGSGRCPNGHTQGYDPTSLVDQNRDLEKRNESLFEENTKLRRSIRGMKAARARKANPQ